MKKKHIFVVGLRGFPNIQGGVEFHAQNLYPHIVKAGYNVTVATRAPYIKGDHPSSYEGVDFVKIWSPKITSLEAIIHTFLSVVYAAFIRPDIVHIHAIGPSLLTPLARLLGLKVVVTNHGPDYDRQKWSLFAKTVLQWGESWGMRFSNKPIVISQTIYNHVLSTYNRKATIIPNGVNPPENTQTDAGFNAFDLSSRKYILNVARFVPEKRQTDLINAFAKAKLPSWKLVFVGAADHNSPYAEEALSLIEQTPDVITTGPLYGDDLEKIYANAGVFVLPSSHEGLPIVLLEALSYGLPTIVSDIPAHTEMALPEEQYFMMGDTDNLADLLQQTCATEVTEEWRKDLRRWTTKKYNWKNIAGQTIDVYQSIIE